jgi:hypothetical protein
MKRLIMTIRRLRSTRSGEALLSQPARKRLAS